MVADYYLNSTSGGNGSMTSCNDPRCLRHPHWQQFNDPPYQVHVAIGLVMSLMSVLSFTGNGFVIFIYCRYKTLWNPSHALLLNLCVSDLCMAMAGFPLYVVSSFHGKWPFHPAVCEYYGFAGGTFGLLSICTLTAISLDRYYVIVRSQSGRKRVSYKMAYTMIVFAWLYSIVLAIPPLFGWNRYTWEGFGTTCSFDYLTRTSFSRLFIIIMIIFGFIIPLIVIVYCYTYIFMCVYNRRQNLHSGTTHLKVIKGGKEQSRKQVEINTAKTILYVIGLYCMSWTPYAVVSLIGVYGDQSLITPLSSAIPGMFAKASTIYNPCVYGICLPRFKKAIRSFFLQLCCGIQGDLTYLEDVSSRFFANSSSVTESPTLSLRQGGSPDGLQRQGTFRSSAKRGGSFRSHRSFRGKTVGQNARKASLVVYNKAAGNDIRTDTLNENSEQIPLRDSSIDDCTICLEPNTSSSQAEIDLLKQLLEKTKLQLVMNNENMKIEIISTNKFDSD